MCRSFFVLLLIVSAICLTNLAKESGQPPVASVRKDRDGITLQLKSGTLKLQVFSQSVIRVFHTAKNVAPPTTSFSVIGKTSPRRWQLIERSDEVSLRTGDIEVRVNRSTGVVRFYDRNGNALLVEGQRSLTPVQLGNLNTFKSRQDFVLQDDEALYGMGQHQAGLMNYRNSSVRLQQ